MRFYFFFDIVNKMNKLMILQKLFTLLFVDNCKAHPVVNFSNVKVFFLPPKTTSVLQPMDAGVIKCFKGYYRVTLRRNILSQLEADGLSKFSNQQLSIYIRL